MADAARAAGARRDPARQGAARPAAGGRVDLPAGPVALCQPRVPRAHRLWQPARARRGRRCRRALRRTRRLLGLQHVRYRHAGDDFRQPEFVGANAVAGDRCASLHDCLGRRCGAGADLRGRGKRGRGGRRRHLPGGAGKRTLAGRSRQCRGARRHSRHHRRRHRDVRRRRQHQFVQSQRRSAVRL